MSSLSSIVGLRNAINAEDCAGQQEAGLKDPISTMECGAGRMLGVYEPNMERLSSILLAHVRCVPKYHILITGIIDLDI